MMNAQKVGGTESSLDFGKCPAKFMRALADVKTHVAAFRFDPVDIFCVHEYNAPILGNG